MVPTTDTRIKPGQGEEEGLQGAAARLRGGDLAPARATRGAAAWLHGGGASHYAGRRRGDVTPAAAAAGQEAAHGAAQLSAPLRPQRQEEQEGR